jgi:hypothetical protein
LFEPAGFCRSLRILKLFDVAHDSEGRPVALPPHLVEAERRALGLT